jgi:lysophospholipase L1-like esterase
MNKTIRTWLASVAVLAASSGAALLPITAQAAPAPPNSMASTGDSITRAYDAVCCFSDSPQYSWSTGTGSQVNSQYRRLLSLNPTISGHVFNDAKTGAKMADLDGQLVTVAAQKVDYVTVLMGANDLCTSNAASMTPTTTFADQFRTALNKFFQASPNTKMQLLSIPNIYQLYTTGKYSPSARNAWSFFGICQSMLRSSNTEADRQLVVARESADNQALAAECGRFANCLWDGYASFNFAFPLSDLSTIDYFHPNIAGQNDAARISWGVSYWANAR